MKTIIVDLDGTICEDKPTFERSLAKPLTGAREVLTKLKEKGWNITVYTTRGWAEYAMTKAQLEEWEVPYDLLLCGKPLGSIWLDDRAIRYEGWDKVESLLPES